MDLSHRDQAIGLPLVWSRLILYIFAYPFYFFCILMTQVGKRKSTSRFFLSPDYKMNLVRHQISYIILL